MSILGEAIGEFFGQVIVNGFGWVFRQTGAITKWLLNAGKKPYEEVLKEDYNGLIGFIVFAGIIALIISLPKLSGP